MGRVKFNVNTEYAYIQNFKILQSELTMLQPPHAYTTAQTWQTINALYWKGLELLLIYAFEDTLARHGIERNVPVESLVKCRMQDNLEFLQWTKRHWDQYFPGHDYDALARRKGSGAPTASSSAPAPSSRTSVGSGARKPANTNTPRVAPRVGSATGGGSSVALRQEVEAQKEAIAGLEKERDFYFSKLRDIELLIQTAVEENPELEKADNGLVKEIQAILYSTEEGFEIPAETEAAEGEANGGEELETF